MNSLAILALVYAIFTVISSGILYLSLRKSIDASAIYFLIAEFCVGITCGFLFLININVLTPTNLWTGIPIFSTLTAEIAIMYSILSLAYKPDKKWFLLSLVALILITVLIEISRFILQPKITLLIISICLTCLFLTNYCVCRFKLPSSLRRNQFVTWFTWFELGMVGYGIARILGHFSSSVIRPWGSPSDLTLVIFAFYVVFGAFRYVSYIGLRITWVNPTNPIKNFFNSPLAEAIEENDRLLRGLIASNRAIGISSLASSRAHQVRQPLTTIALRADTIRRDLDATSENKSFKTSLDEISNQSSKLAALVKNLRQLFGTNDFDHTPINLQKITNEIIEIIEPTLRSQDIALKKEFIDNPHIKGNSIQIQQVLINIINNSIDALSHGDIKNKLITIKMESYEKFAALIIKDNGVGIDLDAIPNIFDLYKTTKKDGIGVGLWLCHQIVERHQGHISAFNDDAGGAIFKIEIPLLLSPSESA